VTPVENDTEKLPPPTARNSPALPATPSAPPKPIVYGRDQHSVSREHIDEDALRIMYRLMRAGFKAYVVGGGVRDLLLHKRPKDFDIATDAHPQEVKRLFRNSRIIGKRFRLVHVFFPGGKNIEVATFRDLTTTTDPEDTELITRDNVYGTEVSDAFRRDITINALFYDPSTFSVIDYVGGMEDLRQGIVRVIGDPLVRFKEDPVRMLRVVRHAARSGFQIEEQCADVILHHHALLQQSAKMRIFEEFKKDLHSGYLVPVLQRLSRSALLVEILPELMGQGAQLLTARHPCLNALRVLDELTAVGEEVAPATFLAVLAMEVLAPETAPDKLAERFEHRGEVTQAAESLFPHLHIPRKERERMVDLIACFHRIVTKPERTLRSLNHEQLQGVIHLLMAINDGGTYDDLVDELQKVRVERGSRQPGRPRRGGRQERHGRR